MSLWQFLLSAWVLATVGALLVLAAAAVSAAVTNWRRR